MALFSSALGSAQVICIVKYAWSYVGVLWVS